MPCGVLGIDPVFLASLGVMTMNLILFHLDLALLPRYECGLGTLHEVRLA